MGLTQEGTLDNMIKLLKRYNLPYTLSEMDKSRIREYVLKDKKTRGDSINMILLKKIGEAYIHNIKKDEIDIWL